MKNSVKTVLLIHAAVYSLSIWAQDTTLSITSPMTSPMIPPTTLPDVVVTSMPFNTDESAQILVPAKILSGDELRIKQGSSLGDTLSHELGVSTSGFGAGASRPIIRGLADTRIKILQNGMSVSDVSSISNDHAVAADASTARKIEILRGPAALLYGSGAIGGLVNVINERIPTERAPTPIGEAEVRYGTVDRAKSAALSVEGSAGQMTFHVDGNSLHALDYQIPTHGGVLPWSYTHQESAGLGASLIDTWGHIGASVSTLDNRYGVPTLEGAQIDQSQMRYDLDTLIKAPFAAFEELRIKLGYTDYKHSELDLSNVPQTNFSNKSLETRWELTHRPTQGLLEQWHGIIGMQTEHDQFSALSAATGSPDTVPTTQSLSLAGFIVEERDFGPVKVNAGARLESVKRQPLNPAGNAQDRSFALPSYSVGGLWTFMPGYALGSAVSIARRAPATEELYSNGPHDATGTFDKGNPHLTQEKSRNIELSIQKTDGLIRWKTNLFENHVQNFIFGRMTGAQLDAAGNPGTEFNERVFNQAHATIRGAEAEISYNLRGEGFSLRGFTDSSRGILDHDGSLPLQPAMRFGIDVGYTQNPWRSSLELTHAQQQDRLAAFETKTPAYTQVNANLSYTQRYGNYKLSWFTVAKNILNQDIRLSTSVLKDVAPLPGRSILIGVRTVF